MSCCFQGFVCFFGWEIAPFISAIVAWPFVVSRGCLGFGGITPCISAIVAWRFAFFEGLFAFHREGGVIPLISAIVAW